jgi:predicted secreted protein
MSRKTETIAEKLKDERSRKVAFIAHCILNENTIYLGRAFREGCVDEVVDQLQSEGIGIVQMRCPEQRAWGGVLKKALWLGLDTRHTLYWFHWLYMPLFLLYTKLVYRSLAREVAREIKDYMDVGFEVVGIVGIRGSPSCGVYTTMDLANAAERMAGMSIEELDRATFNERCVRDAGQRGAGCSWKCWQSS